MGAFEEESRLDSRLAARTGGPTSTGRGSERHHGSEKHVRSILSKAISPVRIHSKAPCRVDLAGSTLDIWPLYLFHEGAVTVNFAVDRYTTASLTPGPGARITLRSTDLGRVSEYPSLEALLSDRRPKLPLAVEIVRFFAPVIAERKCGFELETGSQAPAGAGISGSSALIIAVTSAFNRWLGTGYSIEKLREISQNVEARIIRVPTGCQDYYPAMYGGVSAIEMGCAGIARGPIDVDFEDLERRIVLVYTGAPRNSGINNWEVTKAHIDGNARVRRNFDTIAAIAIAMRAALERADWVDVARLLREEWSHRRGNAPGISTPLIDRLIAKTRRHGSLAAKACGAGGGGCVLFLVDPEARGRVVEIITLIMGSGAASRDSAAGVLPVKVARRGVRVHEDRKTEDPKVWRKTVARGA
jgi:D-glycero-alpha-D-manno-heptose-7-phosphate kinase